MEEHFTIQAALFLRRVGRRDQKLSEMTIIQILGVTDSLETNRLRIHVVQALEEIGMKAIVEIVHSVDKFIHYKINGIPALIVDGTVVLQKHVPGVEELKVLLKMFDKSTANVLKMKKLLVPTDFSEVASGAFQYALAMAAEQGAQIKVIHVHYPELSPETTYQMEPNQFLMDSKTEMLKKFAAPDPQKQRIETELKVGFPVEEIIYAAEEFGADLIVMGTTGERGLIDRVFGSISSNVAKKATCPVILVPNQAKFKNFDRILYASNFDSISEDMLKRLVNFALRFKADIHFVHVEGDEGGKEYQEVENQLFNILFKEREPSFAFTMSKVEGKSVAESLHEYAIKHQIDLTVAVSPHRSFWENIFHRSVTKSMAMSAEIPLMVLH